nr:MAG TPA: RecR protein [Caudoviricetes sp.]
MDKTNFMNEARRMCSTIGRCDKCPAYDYDLLSCIICFNDECSVEKKLSIVEKWSNSNPIRKQ